MTPPASVEPVVLWRGDYYEGFAFFLHESKYQQREEWKAIPVAAYNELLARANTAKVAADLMRARAERAEAALRFYASDDTYCQSHGPDCRVSGDPEAPEQVCDSSCGWPEILRDNGAKARAALRAGGG